MRSRYRWNPRPLGLMDGYQAEDGSLRGVEGRWYRTGRHRHAQCGRVADLYRAGRRCF